MSIQPALKSSLFEHLKIARELRNATDRYIDLNDIRNSIEKSDF